MWQALLILNWLVLNFQYVQIIISQLIFNLQRTKRVEIKPWRNHHLMVRRSILSFAIHAIKSSKTVWTFKIARAHWGTGLEPCSSPDLRFVLFSAAAAECHNVQPFRELFIRVEQTQAGTLQQRWGELVITAIWRPIKRGKLKQRHVVAIEVRMCQFIFTAAAASYFTIFPRSPGGCFIKSVFRK